MMNPRDYPDVIQSSETDRPLRRGVKMLTITVDGQPFTYGQPGWWASLDDPDDTEGQLIDADNTIRAAARREARAKAKHSLLSPLVIRSIRESCGLSQQEAARVFGGGPKAFEKYEAGEVAPSSSMTRLLLLAARRPDLFPKGLGEPMGSHVDMALLRETVRRSSVRHIYEQIYNSHPEKEQSQLPDSSSVQSSVEKDRLLVERLPSDCAAAIARYVRSIANRDEDRYAALTGILRCDYPRFQDTASISNDPNEVARAIDAIGRLDRSHLLIQSPPGSGKTRIISEAIVEMLARGKRIGVSSPWHKSINNLLTQVERAAVVRKLRFRGVKKSSNEDEFVNGTIIEDTLDNDYAMSNGHDLIAGTVSLFTSEELDQQLDYLFIDEATQVSLGSTVAIGVAAQNLILMGDQMQLTRSIGGGCPERLGMSGFEYLLDGAATVPPERGIFLSTNRRMHPDLCRFISKAFYEDRLMPKPGNERQGLILEHNSDPALGPTGVRFISVEHEGCTQKSETEADRIRQLYEILLAQHWTDRAGRIGPIDTNDILVTSPSSMQVKLLRTRLPKGAQVRMVERFEGQKAAVVLISMAISSSRHLSRQIELLHFCNRLNLAIWAARCVAIIVASPRLLETSCTNIGQLRLVNALSWAKNFADGHC